MPAATRTPRWFLDENSLGVALALQHVRGVITWPGAPDGNLDLFTQLRLWLQHWDAIETLADTTPGPWLASVTRISVRIFADRPNR